ncbi:MAG TPA: proline racemase family protein [Candidatus Limnocylindrales bacterium]|nr:proline racemase family protein [Candidatus Limnocylindrales bacterium]
MTQSIQHVHVVDSHTGGEPTRVVISGGPDLGEGPLAGRLAKFRDDHDAWRSALVNEPRGSDVMVGALLCKPHDPSCAAGVIFFNNTGYLGMCGHGTIGLMVTLARLGRIKPGTHRIETPVGVVEARLHDGGTVTVRNIPCYRYSKDSAVTIEDLGIFTGDVAWGGNWFFIMHRHKFDISLRNVDQLTDFAWCVRHQLPLQGITGAEGAEVDHIELSGPAQKPYADSKNFVLCPGKMYDRSPCGTGTSAKLACLYEDGKLKEGQIYRQEGILGSVFEGNVEIRDGKIIPSIQGSAYITGEADLNLDPQDPFCYGTRT